MKTYSKKSFRENFGTPIATAKKHWVVYLLPLILIAAGVSLLYMSEILPKVLGTIMILGGAFRMIQIASVKWHLTEDHLFIESGIGRGKKYQQVPVYDIYKSSTSTTKVGRVFNFGTVVAKRRSEHCTGLRHSIVSNPKQFHSHIHTLVQKSPAKDLNQIYELREKGLISESEYNVMKLGYITQHHLS
jgi:hypothetical protein